MTLYQDARHVQFMRCMCKYGWTRTPPAPAISYQHLSNRCITAAPTILFRCIRAAPAAALEALCRGVTAALSDSVLWITKLMLMQLQIDIVQLLYMYRYIAYWCGSYASWLAAIPWVSCNSCSNWLVATSGKPRESAATVAVPPAGVSCFTNHTKFKR